MTKSSSKDPSQGLQRPKRKNFGRHTLEVTSAEDRLVEASFRLAMGKVSFPETPHSGRIVDLTTGVYRPDFDDQDIECDPDVVMILRKQPQPGVQGEKRWSSGVCAGRVVPGTTGRGCHS